jgi:coenzyme F420-reducing hydrogenase gamma subunit
MEMEKKKVALFSLTDCQGCEFVVLQLGEKLLDVAKEVDFANFRLASSKKEDGPFFISFVDGAVTSSEEVERLKWIRSNSKYLVALGSCATIGGVNTLKNYFTNVNFPKEVYS